MYCMSVSLSNNNRLINMFLCVNVSDSMNFDIVFSSLLCFIDFTSVNIIITFFIMSLLPSINISLNVIVSTIRFIKFFSVGGRPFVTFNMSWTRLFIYSFVKQSM